MGKKVQSPTKDKDTEYKVISVFEGQENSIQELMEKLLVQLVVKQ